MSDRKSNTRAPRFIELDGLRGLAALAVVITHLMDLRPDNSASRAFDNTPLHLLWDGAAAVVLFFVLSGFVLAHPYVRGAQRLRFVEYAARRIFRIYPVYLVAVAISLVLRQYVFQHDGLQGLGWWMNVFWHNGVSWTLLADQAVMIGRNFDTGVIDPVVWTLVIETKLSLCYPAMIYLLRRFRGMRSSLLLLAASVGLAVGGPAIVASGTPALSVLADWLPVKWLPLFTLGGVLAKHQHGLMGFASRLDRRLFALIGVPTSLAYGAYYAVPGHGLEGTPHGHYVVALGAAGVIVLAVSRPTVGRFLRGRAVQLMGKLSYSLYLVHLPLLLSITSLLHPIAQNLLLDWAAVLLASVALSLLLHRLVEEPSIELGRRVTKRTAVNSEKQGREGERREKEDAVLPLRSRYRRDAA